MSSSGPIRPYPSRLRITVGVRDKQKFPFEDDQLGMALYSRLEEAVKQKKLPRPSVLSLHSDQVTQYDILPLLKAGADVHRFVSAVSGQVGIEAVATVGLVRMGPAKRKGASRQLASMCFVEWPDSSWWGGLRLLEERVFRDDWPAVFRCAADGDPRPGGVGGWFSRSRRENLRLNAQLEGPQNGLKMVH